MTRLVWKEKRVYPEDVARFLAGLEEEQALFAKVFCQASGATFVLYPAEEEVPDGDRAE